MRTGNKAGDFLDMHGVEPGDACGGSGGAYINLPVLQQIWGTPWDDFALGLVMALRPSCIRVTDGEEKTDHITWRVTVRLDPKTRLIREIDQAVSVNCAPGMNGVAMDAELRRRSVTAQAAKEHGVGYDDVRVVRQRSVNVYSDRGRFVMEAGEVERMRSLGVRLVQALNPDGSPGAWRLEGP